MKRRDFLKLVAAAAVSPTIVAGIKSSDAEVVTFPVFNGDWGTITHAYLVSENPVRIIQFWIGGNEVDKKSFDRAENELERRKIL